jgi:hypothetical protein
MQLFASTETPTNIFKYMFIIHETLNGTESFYHQQHTKKNSYSQKKTKYVDLVRQAMDVDGENCVKFYKCLFANMVIAKITTECFVIIAKQTMEVRCFNCKSGLIAWLFSSGFFASRDTGCSCEKCNYERIEEYREKSGLDVTKERVEREIGKVLQ